jgi:Tfp pilus assembly protein PilO
MSNIISIIFILAALGLTFGYTYPRYNSLTGSPDLAAKSVVELKEAQIQYEEALRKTAEIEEIRNGLLTRYNSISEADRARINKLMPDNIDSVRLVVDINNTASLYGMSLRDISLTMPSQSLERKDTQATVVQSQLYSYAMLSFSVTGVYNNLTSFLGSLEKSLRVADITNLSIESVSPLSSSESAVAKKVNVPAESLYKMKVSLRTYYLSSK